MIQVMDDWSWVRFQSLIGKIQTKDFVDWVDDDELFQSLIGKIQTMLLLVDMVQDVSFNPS